MSDKNNGNRIYLKFSDAELDLIYEHQKEIDVEFSEEEKNFSFFSDEYLDLVYKHSHKIKISEVNKKTPVFKKDDNQPIKE